MSDVAGTAWLITDATDGPTKYSIRVETEPAGLRAIAESHWIAVVSSDRITRIGRIARLRTDLRGVTIYLDRAEASETAFDLSAVGISDPQGKITRLDWPAFESCLAGLGLESLRDVSHIDDPVHVREILEASVRDDLLGPAGGPFEEVVDMSVCARYLVGKLAPMDRPDADDGVVEPASGGDETGDVGGEELDAPRRHEPGAEFSSVSGRVDAESDAFDEVDTANNQSLVPSSMGMTFCVAPGVQAISVEASWGRYERVPNDEHEHVRKRNNPETGATEEVKVRVWRRTPCGGERELFLRDGPIDPIVVDDANDGIRVQGTIRTNEHGERLVTLFLVNAQEEPPQNKDKAWVFQPELIVGSRKTDAGRAVFVRRPSTDSAADDPERDRLALIYRNRLEFAVGHGVSVHADVSPEDGTRASRIHTEVVPRQEIEVTETPGLDDDDRPAMRRMIAEGWLDMNNLASMSPDALSEALSCLLDDHVAWIDEQEARLGDEIQGFDEAGKDVIERCRETNARLREGMECLLTDEKALQAFRFANTAMALQRVHSIYASARRRDQSVDYASFDKPSNRSWRAFQLAFLLLAVPSIADPLHKDRVSPAEAYADLLWFPTGGGKTEAYLGVAAFTMAMRRLKSELGGLDASRGLAVIMRYTLRLLTLQQFQRATALLCAMETIRLSEEGVWGIEPFTLGLWVGNKVTPGTTEAAKQAVKKSKDDGAFHPGGASPAQLTSCPWCGSDIRPGGDIGVDTNVGRTTIYCGDKYGVCDFSKTKSNKRTHPGLPVLVVDQEIYHRPPTMMIATVDKFAMMAWRPEVGNLFGRVSEECERHGFLWPGHDCGTGHRRQRGLPSASVKPVAAVRPPDLVIQDEFHLISGPLGTMVGLYETAIDELSSWTVDGQKVRPKIVASTATVRRADDQVRSVFDRKVSIFPPSGLDIEDNFFSQQRPIDQKAGRRYIGICAPGSSRPAVLIRVYTAFLTASQWLFERFGPVADPYMTLVGYFNSLRELGGMKRLAEDDVQTRAFRVAMSLVKPPGLSQRSMKMVSELTSRISSEQIPKHLDDLDLTFSAKFNVEEDKWKYDHDPDIGRPTDVVLATNMLSVGVDVDRLGLMVVNGQPKGTAEYIQASSRVGRSKDGPGLVATVLTWARPRDLSHYESFEHYHSTFYQFVEAQSVTPFSPRAIDRGLTGTMLSLLRHDHQTLRSNRAASKMTGVPMSEVQDVMASIAGRTWSVTDDVGRKNEAENKMSERADQWAKEAREPGRDLVYDKRTQGGTEYQLLEKPGAGAMTKWTVPMSMREVEPGVGLIMSDRTTNDDPEWKPPVKKEGDQT